MIKNVFIGLLLIFCLSCCDKKGKSYTLDIIYDSPISTDGKFPAFIGEVVKPFDLVADTFAFPKPINFKRIDMGNTPFKIDAYAFENKGDPTEELYANWLPSYFKDNLPPKELLASQGNIGSLDDWIANNHDKTIIVYALNGGNTFKASPNLLVCEDIANISTTIADILKANPNTKINLVISTESTKPQVVPSIPPIIPGKEDFKKELSDKLTEIGNVRANSQQRAQLAAETFKTHFDPSVFVEMFVDGEEKFPSIWKEGQGKNYFIQLSKLPSVLEVQVQRIEKDINSDKIAYIKIKEIHKN